MYCMRRISAAILFGTLIGGPGVCAYAQNNLNSAHLKRAVSILDSTKDQDGLVGAVRRVKTESAKLELKDGRAIEGPLELVELTTYGIKGNRTENTSYPINGSMVGKEEYKYDEKGNIVEMTLRDERGTILSKEAYDYEFDKIGNWTKMTTNLIVFQNGQVKHEPIEVTYRTLTYYFDDSVSKIVDAPVTAAKINADLPAATNPSSLLDTVNSKSDPAISARTASISLTVGADPPALVKKEKPPEIKPKVTSRNTEASPTPVVTAAANEARPVTYSKVADSNVAETTDENKNANAAASAYEYYKSGRDRFAEGDFKAAVAAYLQSLKIEPASPEVQLNLGLTYLKLEKDKDAVKAFKEAVKLNPDLAEAQYGLGIASFRISRIRDAADAFKKATELVPTMAKAHYGLALCYQELGEQALLLQEVRTLESLDHNLAKKLSQAFPQLTSCRFSQCK